MCSSASSRIVRSTSPISSRIERRRRFVEEHDVRFHGQRAGVATRCFYRRQARRIERRASRTARPCAAAPPALGTISSRHRTAGRHRRLDDVLLIMWKQVEVLEDHARCCLWVELVLAYGNTYPPCFVRCICQVKTVCGHEPLLSCFHHQREHGSDPKALDRRCTTTPQISTIWPSPRNDFWIGWVGRFRLHAAMSEKPQGLAGEPPSSTTANNIGMNHGEGAVYREVNLP